MLNYFRRQKVEKKELEYQEKLIELTLDELDKLGKESNIVRPETEHGWVGLGDDESGRPTEDDHLTMLNQAYKLWRHNLAARAIIRTMVKFVIGKGANVVPKDKNEKVKISWENFQYEVSGKAPKIKNKWNSKEKEIIIRLFRDGEIFIRKFPGETLKIRFIRPSRIRTPKNLKVNQQTGLYKGMKVSYGIGTNPNDIEDVKAYFLCDSEGNYKKEIPAEEMIHYKIFAESDMKRGISLLEVCAPMLKKHGDWLEDRITLNKVRTAIALIKKVQGTASKIKALRDDQESEVRSTDRHRQKMLERGTVITASNDIEYDMLSPNINAQDVKDDGRAMQLMIAAGVGFPEMVLTSDYSNANYSSTMIAQNPFVREIEDWQDFVEAIYKEIYASVIQNAIENGKPRVPENVKLDCDVEFPTMLQSDVKKENEALEIQHRNKVISKKTWQQKVDLDPETERANMEEEQSDDVYGLPPGGQFTQPGQPPNLNPSPKEPSSEKRAVTG